MQSSSRIEKICANLFLISVAFYLMLIFSEAVMKFFLFHPTYDFQAAGMLDGHGKDLKVELIPDNLYKIKPNKHWGINNDGFRDIDYSTDKHGLKRIAFLGDSFTMGLNVKADETMPKLLEKQLRNYQVYNMGVVGFGPDQELNVLKKYGFRYQPDMVIEAICALNDSGDIYKNGLYTLGPKGELEASKSNPVRTMVFPSIFSLYNEIHFIRHRNEIIDALDPLLFGDSYDLAWMKFSESNEAKFKYSLMKAILKETFDETAKQKIKFLAVIIPTFENMCNDKFFKDNNVDTGSYFRNEQIYQYILDSQKIPNINLVPFFMHLDNAQRCSLYDADNGHLSPSGNLYAAQIIKLYMDNHGIAVE